MTTTKKKELPDDVYIPFVETLFRDAFTLAIGISAQTALMALVWAKSGDTLFLMLAVVLAFVGVVRVLNMRHYCALPAIKNREEARSRENHYIIYGSMHGLVLGTFCLVAIYSAQDAFSEIAAVCIVLATATGIAGRNYGSPRMVNILILMLAGPMALGFILRGDFYHVTLGLLSGPFLLAIHRYADTVRDVLFSAISAEKLASRLAQRFNRALNTMPHGLVMLDPEGKVVVANAEAARLMSFNSPDDLLGRTVRSLLMRGVVSGMLTRKDCEFIEKKLTKALREGRGGKVLVGFSNGQHYEFSAREGSQELGVITFEDVSARVQTEEHIRFMARYDSLTGLLNRAYFHELVGESLNSGDQTRYCALVIVDLDDFKSVNDMVGHPVGDGLIYAVAERLALFVAPGVKVGRFGGDEFMLFFDHVKGEDHLARLMDEVFAGLQGDVDVAGHLLRIQVSAGAVLCRVGMSEVDDMIVKADLALYKAKDLGKNGWQLFESSMDDAFRDRQKMKMDLRNAVETGTLRIVYQPIVAMTTMRIAGCEALCRWDHPEFGPISPGIFIPLAEEMGIISQISTFMLNAACIECARWPEHTSVSVNLSAKDFRNREVVDKVRDALDAAGLAPHRLEVEVTETALLDDKSETGQILKDLKLLGVRIALDDFGTGYSSLSYLHKLPLDKVKIDRSFLSDVTQSSRSLELLKGIVSLSRSLGLTVTIEGVETFEQLRTLSQHIDPDLVQGFLFGAALSASGIETMSTTRWPFAHDTVIASGATLS
ncbi:putative bifunctional diguanylate cyclase/phosphodiesterase [Aquamicrobium segne]|uniref:Bifunctional diguanylate cyclase/phosphodiesterase n=1 Tax=Aquamicrobium segne TaxID=469547 RepID=A0ABW0GU84_9HYPH